MITITKEDKEIIRAWKRSGQKPLSLVQDINMANHLLDALEGTQAKLFEAEAEIAEWKDRAEKAEAERDALLKLVRKEAGLCPPRLANHKRPWCRTEYKVDAAGSCDDFCARLPKECWQEWQQLFFETAKIRRETT